MTSHAAPVSAPIACAAARPSSASRKPPLGLSPTVQRGWTSRSKVDPSARGRSVVAASNETSSADGDGGRGADMDGGTPRRYRPRWRMDFDFEATFGEDYLYFYDESTDDGHSDDDAAEIIGRLELPAGARVLDAPCGTGRIARRLAAAGLDVTGVDASTQFIAMARAEPV